MTKLWMSRNIDYISNKLNKYTDYEFWSSEPELVITDKIIKVWFEQRKRHLHYGTFKSKKSHVISLCAKEFESVTNLKIQNGELAQIEIKILKRWGFD